MLEVALSLFGNTILVCLLLGGWVSDAVFAIVDVVEEFFLDTRHGVGSKYLPGLSYSSLLTKSIWISVNFLIVWIVYGVIISDSKSGVSDSLSYNAEIWFRKLFSRFSMLLIFNFLYSFNLSYDTC